MSKPILFLVDDNGGDRDLLITAFAEAGVAVDMLHADHSQQALEMLQAAEHAAVPPNLLLIDLNLSTQDTGLALLKLMHASYLAESIPAVMWSSSSNPKDRQNALDVGARAFFVKPDDFEGMLQLVASLESFLSPSSICDRELAV